MEENALRKLMDKHENIVFFGGAGVSTESGIPDFRSPEGIYHERSEVPAEEILSHTYFTLYPEAFFDFYRRKMLFLDARPNDAHRALAWWEREGRLKAVITQNIDGLHQAAGSRVVIELHGSVHRNRCLRCGQKYDAAFIKNSASVPHCSCGGMVKPEVVLYEEPLDTVAIERSVHYLSNADLLIVGGTSLNVYPAAGLLRYFGGSTLVLINREATGMDGRATLLIRDRIGQALRAATPECFS